MLFGSTTLLTPSATTYARLLPIRPKTATFTQLFNVWKHASIEWLAFFSTATETPPQKSSAACANAAGLGLRRAADQWPACRCAGAGLPFRGQSAWPCRPACGPRSIPRPVAEISACGQVVQSSWCCSWCSGAWVLWLIWPEPVLAGPAACGTARPACAHPAGDAV